MRFSHTIRKFSSAETVLKTTLNDFHRSLGAKMVPFAGYDMPVKYPLGTLKEHLHTRAECGIFDVSHMGQTRFRGKHAAALLERATVVDTKALKPGQASLSLIMTDKGTIKDDCIITKVTEDEFYVVINAGCKVTDLAHIEKIKKAEFAGKDVSIQVYDEDFSLIAIQGPKAAHTLGRLLGSDESHFKNMQFMSAWASGEQKFAGQSLVVSRCGYTGEDGFEVGVPNKVILEFMDKLLKIQNPDTKVQIAEMIGLGARDSLRLEAGLCLYGHDINETISPIEAMLAWTISKRRKEEGGYLGSDIVKEHIEKGVSKKRCGFVAEGKLPVREGAEIFNKGTKVGVVTSGGPAPCLNNTGIGMAYVESPFNKVKTELTAVVRGKEIPIKVHKMPFVPNRYYKPE